MVSPITTSFIKDRPAAPTATIVDKVPSVEEIQELFKASIPFSQPIVKFSAPDYFPSVVYTTLTYEEVLRLRKALVPFKKLRGDKIILD